MYRHPLTALALALSLFAPITAGSDAAPYAPLAVVAFDTGADGTLVVWLPGEAPADAYRVYGLNPSLPPVLLYSTEADRPRTTATVSEGFAHYGVSGVHGGVESPLTLSAGHLTGTGKLCVRFALQPEPYVTLCTLGSLVEGHLP